MTLKQFWSIIVRQWLIILICFVVLSAGSYVKSKLTHPVYKATALVQVAVGSGSTYLDDLLANDQLVQTEVLLATSDPVLRTVASHYPGLTVEQLVLNVSATSKTNSQLVEIDVLDTSPVRAAAIANDVAQTFIDLQNKQQMQSIRHDKLPPSDFLLLVQPAEPPTFYVQPNTPVNVAIGTAAGLVLGLLLAIIIDLLDTRVRSVKLLSTLVNEPLLTQIKRVTEKEDLTHPEWRSANIENYNMLRTRLGFLSSKQPMHTILVTSPAIGDGKSQIAANLAVTMANTGRKTLLIDANLRTPCLHEKFNLPAEKAGLSNAILSLMSSSTDESQSSQATTQHAAASAFAAYMHPVGIPNLQLMPSGPLPPNPSELLSSTAMERFCSILQQSDSELIIYDSSALTDLPDTSALLTKVDGIMTVLDITSLNRKKLKALQTLSEQSGTAISGYVVNKVARGSQPVVSTEQTSKEAQLEKKQEQNGHTTPPSSTASLSPLTVAVTEKRTKVN